MAGTLARFVVPAIFLVFLFAVDLFPTVTSVPIPGNPSLVEGWFRRSVKPIGQRRGKSSLDPNLVKAETNVRIIKVRKDGTGQFRTVTEAVRSVPAGNTNRVIIWIGGGEYREKITVDRSKPYITFYGSPANMPRITFDGDNLKYGTVYSATVAVESDYFTAANIIFVNSSPKPDGKRQGAQALAMRISGDRAAFYNCRFIGYQDTLCDDRGRHFFKDCYIQGTVDFIFGSGKSLYLNTQLRTVADGLAVITAQARELEAENTGFVFVHCSVSGTGDVYLGRAWRSRPKVVFAYSNMGAAVNRAGWSDGNHPERDNLVFFGEYKNKGPGANPGGRVKYTKVLSPQQVIPFISLNFINGGKWLLPAPNVH